MNGDIWHVEIVDPRNPKLVDRTHALRVATTDPKDFTVYLSKDLSGQFLMRVFTHELGHCVMYSYGLIDEIHRMTYPEYWIDAEEWVCNFLADYGYRVFQIAYSILRDYNAWMYVPGELERFVS